MYLIAAFVLSLALFLALCAISVLILRQKSSLIFGIYPERGLFYYLKYSIAVLIVRRLRRKIFVDRANEMKTPEYLTGLDRAQILSTDPKSYDVVSFVGANSDGYKVMLSVERRRRGVLRVAFYLWVPERGLLSSPKLPDMINFSTDGTKESEGFSGNGFKIYPVDSMKKWHLLYKGNLRQEDKLYPVSMDFEFVSTASYFDYNRDLSECLIADSVAREAWNEEFFSIIRHFDSVLAKRTHYEQKGELRGTFQLEDEMIELQIMAFRDHSFGTDRCLSNINRYVYFALFLNDGTCMVVGNLSQPSFFLSSLKVGFVCSPNGDYQSIIGSNYELYSYGERGTPPIHQNFIVHTNDHQYFVQIEAKDSAIRYVGGNWESKVYNQFVTCTINGVEGHGICIAIKQAVQRSIVAKIRNGTENCNRLKKV